MINFARSMSAPLLAAMALVVCSCQDTRSYGPGTRIVSLKYQDHYRSYMLHLPAAYQTDTPLPVLILLHDSRDNGEQIMSQGDFLAHADHHNYIVVAPNALAKSFNDGSGRIGPMPLDVDDVGFLDLVIEDVTQKIRTDPAQRFIAGYGSGGSMAQRAAMELRSPVTGAASISGHLWVDPAVDFSPRSLLLIFGNDDPRNPLTGGSVFYSTDLTLEKPAPMETALKWSRLLSCSTARTMNEAGATRTHWPGCAEGAALTLLQVDHEGALWPPPKKGRPTLKRGRRTHRVRQCEDGRYTLVPLLWLVACKGMISEMNDAEMSYAEVDHAEVNYAEKSKRGN